MATDTIHPVYLLKGKEPVLRSQALADLVDRLTDPAFRDFDLERVDARTATAEQILSGAASVPFASLRHVTVVDEAQRLAPDVTEKLQKLLPGQIGPQGTVIFVVGDGGDGERVQGVVRRLTNLAKANGVVQTYDPMTNAAATQWLAAAVRRTGHTLAAEARTEMLARVGPNLGILQREIEKLVAFAGGRTAITKADVVDVVPESAEYSVFTLVDAVSERRLPAALHRLHRLRAANESAHGIMALLARQLRLVWQAKILMEDRRAVDRLPAEPNLLKLPPYLQEKARRQAARLSWQELANGLKALQERDLALKGIEGPPSDDDEALETLLVTLCRPR